MTKKNWKIYYPLLLGLYSAVALVSVNISQMTLLAGIRSILAAGSFSLVIYALCCWRIRDEHKAALLCGWFFLMFFSYGHVYDAIEGWNAFGIVLGRHRFLFPAWLVVSALGAWMIFRSRARLNNMTRALNIASLILLVIPVFQIGSYEWKRGHPIAASVGPVEPMQLDQPAGSELPDIYYLIPDGYARDDILLKAYDLDISGFISQLEAMGFYIPRCSQSNYAITTLSLASSLSMDYIDQIIPVELAGKGDPLNFEELLKHSPVRQMVEGLGYEVISFENGITWTEWTDADVFFQVDPSPYSVITNFRVMTEFETLYLRTTALRVIEEVGGQWFASIFHAGTVPHTKRILAALENLKTVPRLEGPKFVFLHLISPHEPFVFSPDGGMLFTKDDMPGYPNQIEYLNTRLVPLMQQILEQSSIPPIIIIQADHGRGEGRLANFTALYFPSEGRSSLYPSLTPVNIFRLVFNNYFGQNYPLLPDMSYYYGYGTYDDYSDFNRVLYPCDADR